MLMRDLRLFTVGVFYLSCALQVPTGTSKIDKELGLERLKLHSYSKLHESEIGVISKQMYDKAIMEDSSIQDVYRAIYYAYKFCANIPVFFPSAKLIDANKSRSTNLMKLIETRGYAKQSTEIKRMSWGLRVQILFKKDLLPEGFALVKEFPKDKGLFTDFISLATMKGDDSDFEKYYQLAKDRVVADPDEGYSHIAVASCLMTKALRRDHLKSTMAEAIREFRTALRFDEKDIQMSRYLKWQIENLTGVIEDKDGRFKLR